MLFMFKLYALEKCVKELQSSINSSHKNELDDSCTQRAFTWIRSYLLALLDTKPYSHRLLSNVLLIRFERTSQIQIKIILDDVS